MKKIILAISMLMALVTYNDVYSCKHNSDCKALGEGFKCCYDLSKAKHACIFGCGCNEKHAPCPDGYRCCYDAEIAHHTCINAECCSNKDCPENYACCESGNGSGKACYSPEDPNYCDGGE